MIDLQPLAATLGCGFISISSRRFAGETFGRWEFAGWKVGVDTDADLPTDLEARHFPDVGGCIVADVTAVGPRRLELLLVDC